MSRPVLTVALTLLVLTAPLASAAVWDQDAGLGGDAPNAHEQAVALEPGSYTGGLDASLDIADWYAVSLAPTEFLRVTLDPAGSAWMYLELRDADGTLLHNDVQTSYIDPLSAKGTPTVKVGVKRFNSGPYTLAIERLPAPAQNDAGLGTDASDTKARAAPLAPGRATGALLPESGDTVDWYRVDVGPGQGLNLSVATDDYLEVAVHDAFGTIRSTYTYGGSLFFDVARSETLWIALTDDYGDSAYALDVTLVDRPDLAITALAVEPREVATEAGDIPITFTRDIIIDVAETRGFAASQAQVQVWAHATTFGDARPVGTAIVDLPANGNVVVRIPWTTLGQVGDMRIRAVVTHLYDLDPRNDAREAEAHVLLGNTGLGLDAFEHSIVAGPVREDAGHSPTGQVLFVGASIPVGGTIGATLGTRNGQAFIAPCAVAVCWSG